MNILTILHKDHINMSKLLTVLEENVHNIRQGGVADLALMAEAIEYIGHYADVYHHPLEDIIYGYFSGRSSELNELMRQCEREHKQLHANTEDVLRPISQTLLDGIIPIQDILVSLDKFMEAEKRHLDFEECRIFPLIESIANEDDWQTIAKKSWLKTDAMFGEFETNQYAAIYAELMQVQA